MKSSNFCDITQYSPLIVNRRFGGTCRLKESCLPPAFKLVSCLAYSSTLKTETCSSETSVDFQRTWRYNPDDITLLIRYFAFVSYWRNNSSTTRKHITYLQISKASNSCRREILYNILTEFDISTTLIRLIRIRLNKICNTVRIGKHLSDMLPTENDLKQGQMHYCNCFSYFL
jgi:hypothetical protein